jgi:hypothetical protein
MLAFQALLCVTKPLSRLTKGPRTDPWLQQLTAWHNFYLLLGTAAATLTGLMFVVVSLGPQLIADHTTTGVGAFITPAVVYFTTVLVVAALMTVPAVPAPLLGALLALGSLGGLCCRSHGIPPRRAGSAASARGEARPRVEDTGVEQGTCSPALG